MKAFLYRIHIHNLEMIKTSDNNNNNLLLYETCYLAITGDVAFLFSN